MKLNEIEKVDEDLFTPRLVELQKDGFRAGWEAATDRDPNDNRTWQEVFDDMKIAQRISR